MARIITKQLAERIIKKLKGVKISSGAHDQYAISDLQGTIIAVTGLRHGSNKESGHDHMPEDLCIGPGKAKALAQCRVTRKQYIEILREQGDAPPELQQAD